MKDLGVWISILIGFSLVLTSTVSAQGLKGPKQQWFACQSTRDCTLDFGVCGGPAAINRNFVTPYRQWIIPLRQATDCAVLPFPETVCLSCEQLKCIVRTPRKKQGHFFDDWFDDK